MENKIAIGTLSSLLAQATGKSKKLSEDFLREFFKLISKSLVDGDPIKIKGFGTFKLVEVESRTGVNVQTGEPQEIGQHKKVVFTPSKELASLINAPFEEFESVELEDEMPEDFLFDRDEEEIPEEENKEFQANEKEEIPVNEEQVEENLLRAGSEEEADDDVLTYEAYREIEKEEEEEKVSEKISAPQEEHEEPEDTSVPMVIPVYDYEEKGKSRFGLGFLTGALSALVVCVVIFMLGCFFDWWPVNFGNAKELISSETNPVESITAPEMSETEEPAVEEEPVPEPVYDTVSTTRYLTTIARDHYGNFNFWPYIYLENESILGHPDRITPGTKIVVPELKKYGVDPSNKEDVATAKRLASDIYAKFK